MDGQIEIAERLQVFGGDRVPDTPETLGPVFTKVPVTQRHILDAVSLFIFIILVVDPASDHFTGQAASARQDVVGAADSRL